MSFAAHSQPRERDEDEAPVLPLTMGDDAPHLTDETDAARLERLTRNTSEATGFLFAGLRLLAEGKHQLYGTAMARVALQLTEAAALARVLSKSFTAKR